MFMSQLAYFGYARIVTKPHCWCRLSAIGVAGKLSRLLAKVVRAKHVPARRGELIGLRWQDVDFENLILHVG